MTIPPSEFLTILFTLLVFLFAVRTLVLKDLVKASNKWIEEGLTPTLPEKANLACELRPAEIAFLVRKGDATHALIVMAFDLMQRAVKQKDDQGILNQLTDYEKNMWKFTLDAVKNWARKTAREKLIGNSNNPVQIAKRLSFVYQFVVKSLKVMVQDLFTDPKKIRQYFSYKGLWRVIADFSAAGYKQAFEDEVRASLLSKKLIVDRTIKEKYASLLFLGAVLGFAGTLIVAFVSFKAWFLALIIWFTATLSALALRIILIVRQLLPLYEELAVVADQIERKSRRLNFLKFVIKSVDAINWTVAILLLLVISMLGLGLAKLFFFQMDFIVVGFYIGLLVANFASFELLFQSINLKLYDYITPKAEKELSLIRTGLKDVKPIDSFKELLESQEYNPRLSKLMAIYGIETLFILA